MSVSVKSHKSGRRLSTLVCAALVIVPLLLFYGMLAAFNTNLPMEDDYNGLFNFSLHWQALPDIWHRLHLVMTFQHNEYRMPLVFSLVGLELQLTHFISVPLWIWTGNLLVLAVLFPLWQCCAPERPLRERLLLFAPAAWILMSLGYAETVDFALCGMQFVLVTALCVQTLFCISRAGNAVKFLGCVFALLACATYVNAFMMAPIGIPLLWRRGSRKVFVAWVCAFALGIVPFVYHYHFGKHDHPGSVQTLLFFLAVIGGPFGFHAIYAAAVLFGLGLTLLFAYLVWKRADRVAPFAFWLSVWLVLGFLLITFGRASFGTKAALVSRYKIWSQLLLAALYLQVMTFWRSGRFPRLQRSFVLPSVIVCAVLFGLGSDALGWYRLHWRRVDLTYAIGQYVESGGKASPASYPVTSPDHQSRPGFEEFARDRLTGMLQQGLYRLPSVK